jgi:hypothetical protein
MKSSETTEKCAHPPCKCAAQTVGGYCSEHCKNAQGGAETVCRCGHPDCH